MAEKHHWFYSISLTTLHLMLFFSTTRIKFKVLDHHWWRPLGRFSLSFIGIECLPEKKKKVCQYVNTHMRESLCVWHPASADGLLISYPQILKCLWEKRQPLWKQNFYWWEISLGFRDLLSILAIVRLYVFNECSVL